MKRVVLITVCLINLLVSCKKETVKDGAPSLIGTWKHYSSVDAWHIIYIQDDSQGRMEWYTNGKLFDDTKIRTWYLKDNTIHFGKLALNGELYEVTEFPYTAGSTTIELFDTLYSGKRIIKLDDKYYVEQ